MICQSVSRCYMFQSEYERERATLSSLWSSQPSRRRPEGTSAERRSTCGWFGRRSCARWGWTWNSRMVMHDKKPHVQFVGEIHQVLLDDPVWTGIRASAIAQDDKGTRMGILFLHVLVFDLVNIVTDELGSVVAGSEGHIADVLRHIIDAVRNNQTVRERREVMLKGPEPSVGQSLPSALEVPGNLFFLGVNAYNRKAYGLRFFATDAIRRTARSYPSPLPSAAPCRRNAPEVQGNQGLACVHLECRGRSSFLQSMCACFHNFANFTIAEPFSF